MTNTIYCFVCLTRVRLKTKTTFIKTALLKFCQVRNEFNTIDIIQSLIGTIKPLINSLKHTVSESIFVFYSSSVSDYRYEHERRKVKNCKLTRS